jgi:hypothetical protein
MTTLPWIPLWVTGRPTAIGRGFRTGVGRYLLTGEPQPQGPTCVSGPETSLCRDRETCDRQAGHLASIPRYVGLEQITTLAYI